jgi:predicted transcriptional regulator
MATIQAGTLSLPDGLQAEIEQVARSEGRSVNDVLAEAVDRYVKDKQWQSLKSYGRRKARERGVKQSDVPKLIAEFRRENRKAAR